MYRKIKLTTVNHNKEHIMPAIIKYIKNMVNAYLWGDFNIDNLSTYGEIKIPWSDLIAMVSPI